MKTNPKYQWRLFQWNRRITNAAGSLYMTRWYVDFWLFSIRLHRFSRSDDDRWHHDHPWWFATLVLKGGYYDITRDANFAVKDIDLVRPGRVRYRPFGHTHTVELRRGQDGNEIPAWTLVVTGRNKHRRGFYVQNSEGQSRFVNSQRYFKEFGHH